jgi:hypothetical protein
MRRIHSEVRRVHSHVRGMHYEMRRIHSEVRSVHSHVRGIHYEMRRIYFEDDNADNDSDTALFIIGYDHFLPNPFQLILLNRPVPTSCCSRGIITRTNKSNC